MVPVEPPHELTPDERLRQIAGALAAGVLRLHKRGLLAAGSDRQGPENPPESGDPGLELSADAWLSVRAG